MVWAAMRRGNFSHLGAIFSSKFAKVSLDSGLQHNSGHVLTRSALVQYTRTSVKPAVKNTRKPQENRIKITYASNMCVFYNTQHSKSAYVYYTCCKKHPKTTRKINKQINKQITCTSNTCVFYNTQHKKTIKILKILKNT